MTDDTPMAETPPPEIEITDDDRLWALLAWILTPLVPILLLVMEDKKDRPFIKAHNGQALAIGVVQVVLWALSFTCITAIVGIFLFLAQIYWGIQAYNGKYVTIPVVTDFVKDQGWA